MAGPQTKKPGSEVGRIVRDLNIHFGTDLPVPTGEYTTPSSQNTAVSEKCVSHITYLHFKGGNLAGAISSVEEWALGNIPGWRVQSNQTFSSIFPRRGNPPQARRLSENHKNDLTEELHKCLSSEVWLVRNSIANSDSPPFNLSRRESFTSTTTTATTIVIPPETRVIPPETRTQPIKRRQDNNIEVFSTAPSSPVFEFDTPSSSDDCDGGYGSDTYTLSDFDEFDGFDFDFVAEVLTDYNGENPEFP
ncbi:uncharacterized protein GIQ15_06644 [Arthroderma uncinatum]|uniref:uncharacterized protein n=1 Tax=Arthroderma uncinatum TaxID=74035 RepID=UPI00144AC146|nr:uncharacterized protein GIQ15_06644 [Arthroderma uncinatum]KAF3479668.1 hypothetical protein GIQ15_06644 [Arthroderma uncinatum]